MSDSVEDCMDALLAALSEAQPYVQQQEGAAAPSQSSLPVVFPPLRRCPAGDGGGNAAEVEESIDALMSQYLGALGNIRKMDRRDPPPPATDSSVSVPPPPAGPSLESKLGCLMTALNRNGSDQWVGKPEQISLHELIESQRSEWVELGFGTDATVEVVSQPVAVTHPSCVEDTSIEHLAATLLRELRCSAPTAVPRTVAPADAVAVASKEANEPSMQALLDELDELF